MSSKISCQIYTLGMVDRPNYIRYGYIKAYYIDSNGKTRKIKAMLSKSDYFQAVDAHLHGKYVMLCGEIIGDKHQRMFDTQLIPEEGNNNGNNPNIQ